MGSILDLDITITLYDKSYTERILDVFKRYHLSKPVYIVESTSSYQFEFNSDYHQYEMQNEIASLFEGFEFKESIGAEAQIGLKIHIAQSPSSSDSWGRPWNEDTIYTTRYLARIVAHQQEEPKTKFRVLFDDELREYQVHIGISRTEVPYYVVLKEDVTKSEKIEFLSSRKFETPGEAFWEGYRLLSPVINEEYEAYLKAVKKANRTRRKKNSDG